MRLHVIVFMVATAFAAGALGTAAFSYGDVPRAIEVTVVGDASAYLSIAANGASPHDCFVDVTNGKVAITFDGTTAECGANGGGTGVNKGDATTTRHAWYAFHDLMVVTNRGTGDVKVWLNATTTSGSGSVIMMAHKTTASTMVPADYAETDTAPVTLAPGDSYYVGIYVDAGTLTTGSVTGTLSFDARRV